MLAPQETGAEYLDALAYLEARMGQVVLLGSSRSLCQDPVDDDGKRLMLRWARLEGRSCNSLPVMCGLVQASRIVDEVAGKIAEVRCR